RSGHLAPAPAGHSGAARDPAPALGSPELRDQPGQGRAPPPDRPRAVALRGPRPLRPRAAVHARPALRRDRLGIGQPGVGAGAVRAELLPRSLSLRAVRVHLGDPIDLALSRYVRYG